MNVDVLVLGAGISGLSAAYYLKNSGINTLVIEKQKTVGGRAQSTNIDDVSIDSGALFLTNSYKRTFKLLDDLKRDQRSLIEKVKIETRNGIVAKNKIYNLLPPHSYIDIVKLLPFRSLIRLSRLMLEVLPHNNELDLDDIIKGYQLDTESIADFSNRYLDSDILNYVIDPILQGIWYWDPANTTKVALYLLFKQALTMELYTLKDGIKDGIGVLANSLAQNLLETEAIKSNYDSKSEIWKTKVRKKDDSEEIIKSKIVLCTLPAIYIKKVFSDELPNSVEAFFEGIKYTSNISTHLLLNEKSNIPKYYGLFYPAHDTKLVTKSIAAVTIQSNKIPSEALQNRSVISIYSTDKFSKEYRDKSDDEICKFMISELETLYPFSKNELSKSKTPPKVIRAEPALPVFDAGYIREMKKYHENYKKNLHPGVFFAGDFMGGPHIEGAVISSENALKEINNFLKD